MMWRKLREVFKNMPGSEAKQAHDEARVVTQRADKAVQRATDVTVRATRFMDEVSAAQRVVDAGGRK